VNTNESVRFVGNPCHTYLFNSHQVGAAQSDDEKLRLFFTFWTLKESYIKAVGCEDESETLFNISNIYFA